MEFVLVDLPDIVHFYPFSLTRSLTEIRVGIFTIKERWETHLNSECQVFTSPYLQSLYASPFLQNEDAVIYINSTCLPDVAIKNAILNLKEGDIPNVTLGIVLPMDCLSSNPNFPSLFKSSNL